MSSIQLGPLAMPMAPWLLLAAGTVAWMLAKGLTRAWGERGHAPWMSDSLWYGALVSLLAARLVFVATNWAAYSRNPWSIIDVRDGGWFTPAGVVAALGWIAWRAWKVPSASSAPSIRRAWLASSLLGVGVWAALSVGLSRPDGESLPELTLAPLDAPSQPRDLAQWAQGKPMLINLWATWCTPCRAEMPALALAQRERPDVSFVFANQGEENLPLVRRFTDSMGIAPSSVAMDTTGSLGRAVRSSSLPTTLFVDAQGRIRQVHVGVLNRAAIEVQLNRLR